MADPDCAELSFCSSALLVGRLPCTKTLLTRSTLLRSTFKHVNLITCNVLFTHFVPCSPQGYFRGLEDACEVDIKIKSEVRFLILCWPLFSFSGFFPFFFCFLIFRRGVCLFIISHAQL